MGFDVGPLTESRPIGAVQGYREISNIGEKGPPGLINGILRRPRNSYG